MLPPKMFLVDFRKDICTAPFLDVQELHSQSNWKSNICIFLYVSVRNICSKDVESFYLVRS